MASDIELTPLLIGIGLDELSVASGQVARLKHAVRKLNNLECQELASRILQMGSASEILDLSRSHALSRYPELFV
jgi:phosphoenolpyruvate-protein phosphotransferase (PTS system enzyme I)